MIYRPFRLIEHFRASRAISKSREKKNTRVNYSSLFRIQDDRRHVRQRRNVRFSIVLLQHDPERPLYRARRQCDDDNFSIFFSH